MDHRHALHDESFSGALYRDIAFSCCAVASSSGERAGGVAVLEEDYSLYDRVIGDNFLTSQIQLVLLECMTVSRLMPEVENRRRDGTGAGFLVWVRRQGQEWRLFDTERQKVPSLRSQIIGL